MKISNFDMAPTNIEKDQPWEAQWLDKNAGGGGKREGTKHGFSKGTEIVLDGTSCMNAIVPPRSK